MTNLINYLHHNFDCVSIINLDNLALHSYFYFYQYFNHHQIFHYCNNFHALLDFLKHLLLIGIIKFLQI